MEGCTSGMVVVVHVGPTIIGGPLHSTSRCPTSTAAVQKSLSCVLMLVHLNKCGVLLISKGGIVVMGVCHRRFCLNMKVSRGNLFVRSWATVQ